MLKNRNPWNPFSLLAAWISANLIGWTTGLVAAGIVSPMISSIPFPWSHDSDMAFAYVSIILLGITIGFSQWIVLRRYLPKAAHWIAATMVGYLLCAIIFAITNNDPVRLLRTEVGNNAILFGFMGIAVGGSQWWVLRRTYLNAGLWVFASALGFLFFMWLVIFPATSQPVLYLRSAMIGAFAAMLTGVWLVRMIHQQAAGVSPQTG